MKKFKKISLLLLLLIFFGILVTVILDSYIKKTTFSHIYEDIEELPNFHTVIILGASVHSNGKLSPVLRERVDTGLRLYENGKVKRFLLSGDNREIDYDEVGAMRDYLLERNVPSSHIFVDPAGIDTYDSMYRSHEIFDIPSAVVVTQQFHLPRTIFIAQNLGLNYKGFPANKKQRMNNSLLQREKLANFKAVFEILSRPVPTNMHSKML